MLRTEKARVSDDTTGAPSGVNPGNEDEELKAQRTEIRLIRGANSLRMHARLLIGRDLQSAAGFHARDSASTSFDDDDHMWDRRVCVFV